MTSCDALLRPGGEELPEGDHAAQLLLVVEHVGVVERARRSRAWRRR